MSELSAKVPRVIALADLADLRWQLQLIGGGGAHDLGAIIQRLEDGLPGLDPTYSGVSLRLGAIHVYSPWEADRPAHVDRVVFRRRMAGDQPECSACYKACTHCRVGGRDLGPRGRDNPLAKDLLELGRENGYDWAVVISIDLLLIQVVRYLQSHGRKIVHGCFPPLATELTNECWASIDLSPPAAF